MVDRIAENFVKFHNDNPHVYDMFEQFSFQMIERGFAHGSAALIFERMRWELMLKTVPDEPVRLNNNYRSRYARLFEQRNPLYKNFFRKRKLDKDSADSVEAANQPYVDQ